MDHLVYDKISIKNIKIPKYNKNEIIMCRHYWEIDNKMSLFKHNIITKQLELTWR